MAEKAQCDVYILYVSAQLLLQIGRENMVRECRQAAPIPEYSLPPQRAFHSSCSRVEWIRKKKKGDAMFQRV